MNKMLFLYNPKSGAGKIRNSLADLIEMFSENDYQVTVYPTKAPLDAIQYIEKNGTQVDEIVVCGGDGILHEALNGLGKLIFRFLWDVFRVEPSMISPILMKSHLI